MIASGGTEAAQSDTVAGAAKIFDPEEVSYGRDRPLRRSRAVLAGLLTVAAAIWSLDFPRQLGFAFFLEQYLMAVLAVATPLVFLTVPARRRGRGRRIPWYDALGAAASCAASVYVAIYYGDLYLTLVHNPLDALIVSSILFVTLLEAMRRTMGLTLVIVTLVFFAYVMAGPYMPGKLQTHTTDFKTVLVYLTLDANALLGGALNVASTMVVTFLLFGRLLYVCGGGTFFNDLAAVLMGRYRGGSAKITTVSSALFGNISGSVVANIVASGVVCIPLMKKSGYRPHVAAAIEAVSSAGGQIMPPVMGAVAFLMAEYLRIPYSEVVLAATIPAVLYYVALLFEVDLQAAKHGIKGLPREEIPSARSVLLRGWIFLLPFAVLVFALFALHLEPEATALYASAAILLIGWIGYGDERLTWAAIVDAFVWTGFNSLSLLMVCAVSGFVIGTMLVSGLGVNLALLMTGALKGQTFLLLVATAVVSIVLGMGMPSLGIYVLLAVVVAPVLVQGGIDPLAAHMFIFYFGVMGAITPPFAVGSFAAATLGKTDPMRTGFYGMRLGWLAYIVPFLFAYSPSLLMRGDALTIIASFLTACAGIWLIATATNGFMLRPIGMVRRFLAGATGIALLTPLDVAPAAIWLNVAGAVVAILFLGEEYLRIVRASREVSIAVSRER